MKALTLYQPWAMLAAIGAKRNETRSWPTHYRGPLAIHSSKKFTIAMKNLIYTNKFFRSALAGLGIEDFPLGCVVAIVDLKGVVPILADAPTWQLLSDEERAFGDFSAGRFAWILNDVKKLERPIPAKGAMGLWEWDERGLA